MCGRFSFTRLKEVQQLLDIKLVDDTIRTTDDGRPTTPLPVVTNVEPRRLQAMRWGLIPPWAKLENGKLPRWAQSTFNAVSEEAASKPAFRSAFKSQRCLVPADGYFEWTYPTDARKSGTGTRHLFTRADGQPMLMAGLWERWTGPEGLVHSFTILTCQPNEFAGQFHNRMPVILDRATVDVWLHGTTDDIQPLLCSCADGVLVADPGIPASKMGLF